MMSIKIKFSHLFAVALVCILFSCSKPEEMNITMNNSGGDITGQWNLVLSTGGRVMPKNHANGEEIWNFENQKLTKSNFVHNTLSVSDYIIVDTFGGNQLKLDNILFASIQSLTNDSLVLYAEKFTGCGGAYFFVR